MEASSKGMIPPRQILPSPRLNACIEQIVAPGFNEAVLELVWKTTTEIYFEMAGSKGWSGMGSGETVEVPDVPELMLKVSLLLEERIER